MAKTVGPAKLYFEVIYACPYCHTKAPWIIGAHKQEDIPLSQPCRVCKEERAAMVSCQCIAKKPAGEE